MGKIVVEALLRLLIIIVVVFFIRTAMPDDKFWLILTLFAVSAGVILPIWNSYKKFIAENKEVLENSLCSRCRHFDRSAVLCTKYEEHPRTDYLPCGGKDFEPR